MAKATKSAAKPAAKKAGGKKTTAGKGSGGRKSTKGPQAALNRAGHNGDRSSDEAVRASFLQHNSRYKVCMNAVKVADKALRDMVAAAKAEGFQKQEFVIAEALSGASAKREAKVVANVETRLRVARWMGHKLADQYDLFASPPARKSSVDEAYEAGRQACMEGDPKKPPPQFEVQELSQRWLAGYDDETERRVWTGIKPLEDKPADDDGQPWQSGSDPEGDKPAAGWGTSARQPATVN